MRYKSDLYVVVESMIKTPPNLASFVKMSIKNLKSGKILDLHCNVSEPFEVLDSEFKQLDFSYEDKNHFVFMDPNTYENFEINRDLIGDDKYFIVPNEKYEIMFVENNAISINLPGSINLKIVDTPETVAKGNTTGNVTKLAKTETGFELQVPHFIKNGDVIRVNTAEKKYLNRVNE